MTPLRPELYPFLLALALPLLAAAGAHAAPVYKCTAQGTTTYADRPCAHGTSRVLPPPVGVDPNVDAVRTGDSRTLLETEKLREKLRVQRERDDRRAEREQARSARAAARQRKQCARHRLHVKWAEEDVAHASLRKQDAARARLRRRQQTMAVECG